MAAAWFNALANHDKARAISAGTEPGPRVHPEVLTAMREVGIDLEGVAPQKLTDELAAESAILITMGCGEQCPHMPGIRRMDWPLEDPKGKSVERVREIRDEVKARVLNLLETEHWLAFRIRPAESSDRAAIESLLANAKLPLDGFEERFPDAYVVACVDGAIVGVAGLEQYGGAGLLRSVAVEPGTQGSGIGRALVDDRVRQASALGVERVVLLTTTAASYFRGMGFESMSRTEAPSEMQQSPEFAGACPASAECLSRRP
jgi:arsenate reductase